MLRACKPGSPARMDSRTGVANADVDNVIHAENVNNAEKNDNTEKVKNAEKGDKCQTILQIKASSIS